MTVNRCVGQVVLRIAVHTDGYSIESDPPLSPDDMDEEFNRLLVRVMEMGRQRISLTLAPQACRCGNITSLGVTHYADRMCMARLSPEQSDNVLREVVEAEVERRVAEALRSKDTA